MNMDFENFEYPEKCPKCGTGNLMKVLCSDCCNKIIIEKFSDQLKKISDKPKSCPFCGLPGELQLDCRSGEHVSFDCTLYECCPKHESFDTVEKALSAWNTRGYVEPVKDNERTALLKDIKEVVDLSEKDEIGNMILIHVACKEIMEKLTKKNEP